MKVRDNSYANVYPEYGIPSDVSGNRSEYEKARRRTARAKKAENEKIFYDNYNPRMTWKENLANLKGLGMKISKSKLYELIKKYNNDTEIFEERMANRN